MGGFREKVFRAEGAEEAEILFEVQPPSSILAPAWLVRQSLRDWSDLFAFSAPLRPLRETYSFLSANRRDPVRPWRVITSRKGDGNVIVI